jgi:hypothetical protein
MRIKGFSLRDVLDPSLPEQVPTSELMQKNLEWYLAKADAAKETLSSDTVLVCDLSRSASASREPMYSFGYCMTLTTRARYLYVYGLDPSLPQFKRFLSVDERCALQGFDPALSDRLGKADPVKALGNAMSLNAVGLCTAALLNDYTGGA